MAHQWMEQDSQIHDLTDHYSDWRKMTTSVQKPSTACCTIQPVKWDYTPKGPFKPYGTFDKVYVTGPKNSEISIVCVFDICG